MLVGSVVKLGVFGVPARIGMVFTPLLSGFQILLSESKNNIFLTLS